MCPHCGKDDSGVLETRRLAGSVYRRRKCKSCSVSFVTVETAPVGLKMPWEGNSRVEPKKRRNPPTPKYQPSAGLSLATVWKPL